MSAAPKTVHEYCRSILESGDLEAKLRPPVQGNGSPLDDSHPGPSLVLDAPVRATDLRMHSGSERLPALGLLRETPARIVTLSRFANHELQAVELFAWALLVWPEMPKELRTAFLRNIDDEQRHFRMYQARLQELGADFRDVPLSNYFWRNAPAILASQKGIPAFLCAVGLTLEQANLDFSLRYRDAFLRAGDEASAAACQTIHDDEINHVRLAYTWLNRMKPTQESDVEAYSKNVPFPFSASRAKGRGFDFDGRRKAGLSEAMIEHVRTARAYEQTYSSQCSGALLFPNLGAEEGESWQEMRFRPEIERVVSLWRLLFGRDGRVLNDPCPHETKVWPAALCDKVVDTAAASEVVPPTKAFAWLEDSGRVVPWLSTQEVETYCAQRKLRLAAPPWQTVVTIHDKAFAQRMARKHELDSHELQSWIHIFEPEILREGRQAVCEIESIVANWPQWARADFTLKPRFGSSGRGRVRGLDGKIALASPEVALERFALRGGAILEPWFSRIQDFSVQLHISELGEIEILAVLCQDLTPAGLYRGHRGVVTYEQEIRSGSVFDDELIAKAMRIAREVFELGYTGPCGMDAFSYRDAESGETKLRSVVEWNARFTTGTIATGLLRQVLRTKETIDFLQGETSAFYFSLSPPTEAKKHEKNFEDERVWPETSSDFQCLHLSTSAILEESARGPAFCFARSAQEIDAALGLRSDFSQTPSS